MSTENTPGETAQAMRSVISEIDRHIFIPIVSESVQRTGQKIIDAIQSRDTVALKSIALKYQRYEGMAQIREKGNTMNTIHNTKSGTVQLVGKEWRDGGFTQASEGVACITVHDDVTNAVWKFTGKLRDAAEVVGRLYVGTRAKMAVLSGSHIEIEQPADDLMIGKGEPNEDGEFDDFEFNASANPGVVAY